MKNINGLGAWGKGYRSKTCNYLILYPSSIQKIKAGSLNNKQQSVLFRHSLDQLKATP